MLTYNKDSLSSNNIIFKMEGLHSLCFHEDYCIAASYDIDPNVCCAKMKYQVLSYNGPVI